MIRDQIRPLAVRAARPVVPDPRGAANRVSKASRPLTKVGGRLNELLNMAAFNPNGAEPASEAPDRDEGYLYWGAWPAQRRQRLRKPGCARPHRRIYFTASCENILKLLDGKALGAHATRAGSAHRRNQGSDRGAGRGLRPSSGP